MRKSFFILPILTVSLAGTVHADRMGNFEASASFSADHSIEEVWNAENVRSQTPFVGGDKMSGVGSFQIKEVPSQLPAIQTQNHGTVMLGLEKHGDE